MIEASHEPGATPHVDPSRVAVAGAWSAPWLGAAWLTLVAGSAAASPEGADPGAGRAVTEAIAAWSSAATLSLGVGTLIATLVLHGARPRLVSTGLILGLPAALLLVSLMTPGSWLGRLPEAPGAATALVGLMLLGSAFGSPRLPVGMARAAALVAAAALLDGAAAGWGVVGPVPPWSAQTAATLLDLSPRALVLETGGVDWMRHPTVYEAVGTDRIGPGIRTGWAGSVAAPVLLVVGCASAALGILRSTGRGRA